MCCVCWETVSDLLTRPSTIVCSSEQAQLLMQWWRSRVIK